MIRKSLCAFGILAVGLSGCAITPENAYPEATTVAECQARYAEDVRVTNQSLQSQQSSGNWIADAIASGLGKGLAESTTQTRLAVCLERIGADPALVQSTVNAGQPLSQTRVPAVEVRRFGDPLCERGAGVLVRGSSYCVGR